MIKLFNLIFFAGFIWNILNAQTNRPIPYPVIPSMEFEKAVEKNTRGYKGLPGEKYWTNFARYYIDAQLSPDKQLLQGNAKIVYYNNSPDTLKYLVLQLYQNINKVGAPRLRTVPITSGIMISGVKVNGISQLETYNHNKSGYKIQDTQMEIWLTENLQPAKSVQLELQWNFQIPDETNPRMGQDGEVFFLAYWYPQIAVYDDLRGWDRDLYLGPGEFYMGYADYDVKITVPDNFLIGATGTLKNGNQILSQQSHDRLKSAHESENTVAIVDYKDLQLGKALLDSKNKQHTWHFEAKNVRDFAFGTSDNYLWDATYAIVDQNTRQKSMVHSFYRPARKYWKQSAHYGQYSLEFLSDHLWPYPWSHMTLIEGLISGGMEFPMITLIGSDNDPYSLFSVIVHEIGHMWFPMLVGTDEKAFTWMDEGLTRFNQNHSLTKYFPEVDAWNRTDSKVARYYRLAEVDGEVPSMRHRNSFPLTGNSAVVATYGKPALGLRALSEIYGEEKIKKFLREYGHRWTYKHPTPYDFFHTANEVLGDELGWFWTAWFYNTWTLDQAVTGVEEKMDSSFVFIEDKGLLAFPTLVEISFSDKTKSQYTIPVDYWLGDHTSFKLLVLKTGITKVVIDPNNHLPDMDISNNIWIRKLE